MSLLLAVLEMIVAALAAERIFVLHELANQGEQLEMLACWRVGCVYRKLKPERSGDEVRPGWRVN